MWPPRHVTMSFTEPPDPDLSSVIVLDADRSRARHRTARTGRAAEIPDLRAPRLPRRRRLHRLVARRLTGGRSPHRGCVRVRRRHRPRSRGRAGRAVPGGADGLTARRRGQDAAVRGSRDRGRRCRGRARGVPRKGAGPALAAAPRGCVGRRRSDGDGHRRGGHDRRLGRRPAHLWRGAAVRVAPRHDRAHAAAGRHRGPRREPGAPGAHGSGRSQRDARAGHQRPRGRLVAGPAGRAEPVRALRRDRDLDRWLGAPPPVAQATACGRRHGRWGIGEHARTSRRSARSRHRAAPTTHGDSPTRAGYPSPRSRPTRGWPAGRCSSWC